MPGSKSGLASACKSILQTQQSPIWNVHIEWSGWKCATVGRVHLQFLEHLATDVDKWPSIISTLSSRMLSCLNVGQQNTNTTSIVYLLINDGERNDLGLAGPVNFIAQLVHHLNEPNDVTLLILAKTSAAEANVHGSHQASYLRHRLAYLAVMSS